MKDQLESLVAQLVERGVPLTMALEEFERRYIRRVLERTNGNHCRAARLLGMHRNTLSRKVAAYQLDPHPNGNPRR